MDGSSHAPTADPPSNGHLSEREVRTLREAQLRGILETASEGIVTVDASQTIVMANRMAAEIFRCDIEALVGSPLSQLIPARFRARHHDAVASFGADDGPARPMSGRRNVTGLRADGEEFPMEAGISQARVDGVRLATVILRDLSEPRRAARALRRSEQLLDATFNAPSVAMALLDPQTRRFVASNGAFQALSGYDETALLSMTPEQLVHPDDRTAEPIPGGEPAPRDGELREQRIVRADGTVLRVQATVSDVRDDDGLVLRRIVVMQDVTARREAESALRSREARQSFLVQLNDHLRHLDSPQDIAFEAACLLGRFVGAQRAGYAEDDGNGESITVTRCYCDGVPALEGKFRYRDYGPELLESFRAGRTVVRPAADGDPTLGDDERAVRAALHIGSAVNVPLVRGARLVAVFFVQADPARVWRDDEVALFEDVAERIRADVERARAEAAVRESKATLEAALGSMADAAFISDARGCIVDFNEAFAAFHRFPNKGQCLRWLHEYEAIIDVTLPDGTPAPLSQWAVPRALRGETGSNVEYALRSKRTGERWVGSYSFAPIRDAEGRIVGSVVTARDITEIRRIRSELEASHANLQRLIAAQDSVQEQERLRIARELHDDVQQSLAALLMETEGVRSATRGRAEHVDGMLDRIDAVARDVIASMRRIIRDLRPQALEELGLVPALRMLACAFSERTGMACELQGDDVPDADRAPPEPAATCLYRVAQEALNNAARHSDARRVTMRMAGTPGGALSLAVSDDGRGFDTSEPVPPESMGLLGMRERVRVFGGSLRVHSSPGRGTTVEVVLPPGPPPAATAMDWTPGI